MHNSIHDLIRCYCLDLSAVKSRHIDWFMSVIFPMWMHFKTD